MKFLEFCHKIKKMIIYIYIYIYINHAFYALQEINV